jgi:hypothetical protein
MTEDLEGLWHSPQQALPSEFQLVGLSYSGPDRGDALWVAIAEHGRQSEDAEYCEGVGGTPAEATAARIEHALSDHPATA